MIYRDGTCTKNGQCRAPEADEIDVYHIIRYIIRYRKKIALVMFVFALFGGVASVMLPTRWSTEAVVTPPLFSELLGTGEVTQLLASSGTDLPLGSDTWFRLFTQLYDAPLMMQRWQTQSNIDPRVGLRFSRESDARKRNNVGYHVEMLSAQANDPKIVPAALSDYMAYVRQAVNKELSIRVRLALQTKLAQGKITPQALAAADRLAVQPWHLQQAPGVNLRRKSLHPLIIIALAAFLGSVTGAGWILLQNAWREFSHRQERHARSQPGQQQPFRTVYPLHDCHRCQAG